MTKGGSLNELGFMIFITISHGICSIPWHLLHTYPTATYFLASKTLNCEFFPRFHPPPPPDVYKK